LIKTIDGKFFVIEVTVVERGVSTSATRAHQTTLGTLMYQVGIDVAGESLLKAIPRVPTTTT
jgi:hypothetical protein